MDYTGNNLTADFESVWKVSVTSFPEMAASYQSASEAVHTTHYSADDNAEFFPKWCDLRDEFQLILETSAINIDDTAAAIRESMNDFAEEDDAAATALDAALTDLPEEAEPMPETLVPWSRRNYDSGHTYADLPSCPAGNYSSSAPTPAELLTKAELTDDKLLEAEKAELGAIEGFVAWIVPDSVITGTAEDMGFEFVVDMVQDLTKSDPAWYQVAVDSLASIGQIGGDHDPFSRFKTEVNNARSALSTDKWDGEAARAFHDNFLDAYEDIADTQVQVLGTLAGAIEGYQEALENCFRKYDEAMDSTIAACDSIIDSGNGALVNLTTSVLSAAITIGGAVATGGSSTAIKFALAGGGVTVASAGFNVGGSDITSLWTNIREGFGTIEGTLNELDSELRDALESDHSAVEAERWEDGNKIQLPRPSFADDPSKL